MKTLNYLLAQNTQSDITKEGIVASGVDANASIVGLTFSALRLKLQTIHALSANESAIERASERGIRPNLEPITVARKPIEGTVAENCLKYGVGGINIDGCRVHLNGEHPPSGSGDKTSWRELEQRSDRQSNYPSTTSALGRFPANLIHDGSDEVVELFPYTKTGDTKAIPYTNTRGKNVYGTQTGIKKEMKGDSGSAARFFYCAKSSKRERGEGNSHPTVKPIALMEYLVKLVSREGAVILDPFAGSGSTLLACKNLNRQYIGIEREHDYINIINARLGEPCGK